MGRAPCKIDRIPFCGGEMGVRGKGFFELDLHVTRKKRSGKPEILDLQSREMGGDSRLPLPRKYLSKIMKNLTPQVYHAQANLKLALPPHGFPC